MQDGITVWVSHVAFVELSTEVPTSSSMPVSQPLIRNDGEVLVQLKDVNASCYERKASVSYLALSIAEHRFPRYYKIQTGQYERVKGGTFRNQTGIFSPDDHVT